MITVLGPVGVDGEGMRLGPRERIVLAALVVDSGETVNAAALADALWAHPPESWRKVVQGCVVKLRKRLGATAIETTPSGYRLTLPIDQIDARLFERLLARARELLMLGDPDRAAYVVNGALDLWRGRALDDLLNWDKGRIEAERLEELRLEAEELRIDASLQAGRYREVLAEAQTRVAEAPLREHRWALLAMALYQAGRQGDALRTLHHARQMLVAELGIDPGPDIVGLEEAILRQDPALIAARLPDPSPVCPYPGLRSFGGNDHDTFFGRETEVAECLEVLAGAGVLAVLGSSGSGKSSLVRAGVGAALEQEGVPVVVVTPGGHPLDVMTGLPGADTGFVLVVDQCEEAMMLCKDPAERARFFDALVAHAGRNRLIIALRADRLGEVSTYPLMARLVERGLYLLKPMVESNLRTAIEAPARQAGLLLEAGLVDVLVRDVEGEPGYLPLLSHALREIWERREGNTLTVAGYNASGGIREAVAQTAERVYEQAPAGQRPLLRDLLLRLVAPSPDGEPVRARVPRRLIAPDEEHEALVERLVEARLVTRDEDAVELSHEAVARAWPRLRSWLDDDLEGQRIWRHLAVAADNWDAMGRPESELYRGARLAQAVEWFRTTSPDVNSLEREFLQDGEQLATAERSALEDQMRHQVRINRRLRLSVGGVALLVVVAVGALLVARGQAMRADAQAVVARSNELAASAISVMEDDPSLAKLLALTAVTVGDTPTVEAMSALHQALISDHVTFRYGSTFDVGMVWADLDPSGDRFVLSGTAPVTGSGQAFEAGAGQVFEIVDTDTGGVQWSLDLSQNLPRHASAFVGSPFFSDDGRLLVAGTFWDPYGQLRLPIPFEGVDPPDPEILGAHIWDADTGRLIDRYDLGRCGGIVVGISKDFLLAKTLSGDPQVLDACRWGAGQVGVQLVDRRTRETTLLTSATHSPLTGAAMSGDGRRVAYDDGGEVVVIDVVSREEILRVEGRGVREMNQDGSQMLVGDAPIQVWSVATGEALARFDGHQGRSLFARFGPDETVLSTGDDGVLRQWEATTGTELFAYPGVGNGRPSFTGDGLVMVARPDRDTVTLLDTEMRGELGTMETCPGVVPANGLAGSGGTVSFSLVCDEGVAEKTYLLNADDRSIASLRPGISLALSPDGERYVAVDSSGSGTLVVRNVADEEVVTRLDDLSGNQVTGVRWSPDATMIAGIVDGGLTVWYAPTGDVLYSEAGTRDGPDPVDIMFSPDSSFLVETTTGWTIRSVSTETWTTVIEHEVIADGGYQMGLAGFTPDGSSVLAVGAFRGNTAGALHWFDVETLQLPRSKINVHDGSITSMALDPEGSKLVTGSSDGMVRVWDVVTGALVHELPFNDVPIEGVAFFDDDRIGVATRGGHLVVATIDPDELVATARASLTRGFTLPECSRYGFEDSCPTVAELGGGSLSGVEGVVNGTYRVAWSPEDLEAAFGAAGEAADILEPDAALPEVLTDFAGTMAGVYTLTFADGRFDIALDSMAETWCTGTYSIHDRRIWLSSERGWCIEVKLFDAEFEVDEQELRFDFDSFHGIFFHKIFFADRPLQRAE